MSKPAALFLLFVVVLLLFGIPIVGDGIFAAEGITSCSELQEISLNLSADYFLENDIDCSDTPSWNGGSGFEPIGNDKKRFTGRFDGKRHVISNLYINRPDAVNVGLFGFTEQLSEIIDVGVINVNILGSQNVGGLVGNNQGAVYTSYTTGTVRGDFFASNAGGLVGYNNGLIQSSYSLAKIEGDWGLGGLVGRNKAVVKQSYSAGSVNSVSSSYVGGLIGQSDNNWEVQSSFWDKETSGYGTSGGGSGRTTSEMMTKSTFTYPAGWGFCMDSPNPIWAINEGKTYPCLNWEIHGCTCIAQTTWKKTLIPIVVVAATLAVVGGLTVAGLRRIRQQSQVPVPDDDD